MNSLFLLAMAVLVFVFGYRFYAKLLGFGVFRLDNNYSTRIGAHGGEDDLPASRHLLFGHHVAMLAAGTTLIGGMVAVIWGWIPAILWLVAGAAVAGGAFGIGAFWLTARHPDKGLSALAEEFIGPYTRELLFVLALFLLLALNAISAVLAAQLLAAYPAAVLPALVQVGLAFVLGRFLRRIGGFTVGAASAVSLAVAVTAIWLLADVPLAFGGAFSLEIGGAPVTTLTAVAAWLIVVFLFGLYAGRTPIWTLTRPHGYLTALLLAVFLLVFLAGWVAKHPPIAASAFNHAEHAPGALPWLFVTLTSGALTGFHLIFINTISGRQLVRDTDARYIGYGGAIADAVVALTAVAIASTSFAGPEDWRRFYASWDAMENLGALVGLYLNGFADLAGALGVSTDFARTFGAVVVLGLVMTTFAAGIRAQRRLLAEFGQRWRIARLQDGRITLWLAVLSSALLAFSEPGGMGGRTLWSLFGGANLVFAALGTTLVALALKRVRYPSAYTLTPAFAVGALSVWVLFSEVAAWWQAGKWLAFAVGLLLLGLVIAALVEAARRQAGPAPKLDT